MMRERLKSRQGFTMAEILIAMTLTGLLLAGAMGSLIFLAKATKGIGNYQEMNMESRFALEHFGSDARMTTDVKVSGSASLSIEVYDSTGGTNRVIYVYDANNNILRRTVGSIVADPMSVGGGTTEVVLKDVVDLDFIYYDLLGNVTTNALEVKEVQIQAEMRRNVLSISNTNEIISARFMMRNRSVSS